MKRKLIRRLLGISLTLLLAVVFTGCQAVGGVDVGKSLSDSWKATSFEGEQTIKLEFATDPLAKPGAAPASADWSVLNNATLAITNWKHQDSTHNSFDGKLTYGSDKSVSFKASYDQSKLVLKPDGASAEIVLELAGFLGAGAGNSPLPVDPASLLSNSKVTDVLMPYVFTNMPNPSAISVSPAASETVHGETLQLQKIHAELTGPELAGMLQQMIGGMLDDEEATKALLSQVLKAMGMDFGGFAGDIVYGFVKDEIVKLQGDLSKEPTGMWATVLNADTALTTDMYVDQDLQVRKANWTLSIPTKAAAGFSTLKLTGTSSKWNINKPVEASVITPGKDAVTWGKNGKMPQIVSLLDKKSAAYDLLMNDMHVYRKAITMAMTDNTGGTNENPLPYINDDGFTMVPVRYVSEKLDASVEWNQEKQEVTITNGWTGQKLVLTIGSETAYLDGKELTIGDGDTTTRATLTHDSTYVPIRIIAEQLFKAKVDFKQGDTTIVKITKE